MSRRAYPNPSRAKAAAGTAALAGATALAARHLRAIATDPEYARLRNPLQGRSLSAISADGTELHAEVFGAEGAATVVLVPGWTEWLSFFDYVTRSLVGDGFRVVAYDLRGQGRSELARDGDYAIKRYGEDLEAVLSASCAGRRDVLVAGHSLGAMSIASWAADHDVPSRVRAVALMNTGLDGLIDASRILPARLPARLAEWLSIHAFLGNPLALPPVSTPISHALIRYIAFGPAAGRAQIAFYEQMLMACPASVRAAAGISMSEIDLLPALQNITVPTLVLAGADDRLTPPSHAQRIAAALPALDQLVVMPLTGHMTPLERPTELSHMLAGMWSRLAEPALARSA